MADVLTPEQRRLNMSRIRARDTKPEMLLRRGLHARGFRYRLHRKELPGRPDLVFPQYRAVVMVNGCFWHGHGCHLFRLPATRREFWAAKIEGNRMRDARDLRDLNALGWRVMLVWECACRGSGRWNSGDLFSEVESWLKSQARFAAIASVDSSDPARVKQASN